MNINVLRDRPSYVDNLPRNPRTRGEALFVNAFVRSIRINGFPKIKKLINPWLIKEFEVEGSGIADFVFIPKLERAAMLNKKILRTLAKSRAATQVYFALLAGVEKKTDKISICLRLSNETTRKLLKDFKDINFNQRNKIPNFEIWAFEAKVDGWREGVRQAFRYRSYADRTFLLLPMSKHPSVVPYLEDINKLGLGLLFFDKSANYLNIAQWPKKNIPGNKYTAAMARAKVLVKTMFKGTAS